MFLGLLSNSSAPASVVALSAGILQRLALDAVSCPALFTTAVVQQLTACLQRHLEDDAVVRRVVAALANICSKCSCVDVASLLLRVVDVCVLTVTVGDTDDFPPDTCADMCRHMLQICRLHSANVEVINNVCLLINNLSLHREYALAPWLGCIWQMLTHGTAAKFLAVLADLGLIEAVVHLCDVRPHDTMEMPRLIAALSNLCVTGAVQAD